ncbi:MAG TPA: SDR family NAD(P)-dependent oxidoreductase, partial [Nitriliruptorales bacterium]
DPDPHTAGEVINIFARAAHAPTFSMRIDPVAVNLVPKGVRKVIGSLPPVENTKKAVLGDLGIPEGVFSYIDWPTEFDATNTRAALLGTDIACPPLEDYAWRLWDHWERHLDPDLFRDRSLRGAIEGRRVLVTGASAGIGKEVALLAGESGAHVLLVSRTEETLREVADEVEQRGGTAAVYACDLTDMDDIDRMSKQVLADHGGVDVIVNNAGRSIRRSVRLSFDRFHDYERTMQLNYFGTVKLILNLLPPMLEARRGHIINVSSIGVQTNTPRFSAYVASKSALDAFSRCIASEIIDDNVHITTVYMPLVRTAMIAPTKMYDYFPALSPLEAGQLICDAMIDRPKKVATALGNFGQILYSISPKLTDQVLHTAYRLFPDSTAAKGGEGEKGEKRSERASAEGVAFAHLLKGIHW